MGDRMDVDAAPAENGEATGQQTPMDPSQVKNNAGGFGWKVDDMHRLKRFLVLGTTGGTYYVTEHKLGLENAKVILDLIKSGKGTEVVDTIREFSVDGRCAKQDQIIFSLAICARNVTSADTKKKAYEVLNAVCRIPTHLFHFVEFCESVSKSLNNNKTGWGRAHRKAVASWYTDPNKPAPKLAFQITKYKQRDGWSHRDLLRLCHAKAGDRADLAVIFKYIVKGFAGIKDQINEGQQEERVSKILGYLDMLEKVKISDSEDEICRYVLDHKLNREHLPTKFLSSKKVSCFEKTFVELTVFGIRPPYLTDVNQCPGYF